MPTRSASIVDVLGAVRQLQPSGAAAKTPKPAPLDAFVFGDVQHADASSAPRETRDTQRNPPASKQQELTRREELTKNRKIVPQARTPQPEVERDRVVLFPTELRKNRFFRSPEMSAKATQFVLEGRRPSSVFSGAISEQCRDELTTLQKVQQLQQANELRSPNKNLLSTSGNQSASNLRATSSFSLSPAQQLVGAWQNDAQYLRHVADEEREELPPLEKLGRRLEYGKVLGLYREELIANKTKGKYANVPKHKEVGASKAACPAPPLDWSHMGIADVPSLIDVVPRSGRAHPTQYALTTKKAQDMERQKRRAQEEGPSASAPVVASKEPLPVAVAAPVVASGAPAGAPVASQPTAATRPLVGFVTSGPSTAPEHVPLASTSRYDSLRYCFGDKDAEKVLPSSSMVIIKTKDTTYAFNEGKKKRSIESLLKSGGLVSADGTININRCLQCMRQFDAQLINLSHNKIQKMDHLLSATLATLLRTCLVRLDLSFNSIRQIDADFFGAKSHFTPQQKKDQLLATTEKVAQLQEDLANEPETASLIEKKREFFRRVRLLALLELGDVDAPKRLLFDSLRALYLHGNPLESFEELFKLRPLAPTLQALTFHGGNNDLDREAGTERNRRRLLQAFPSLVSLNFTTLVASDDEL